MYKKVLAWHPANRQAEIKKFALNQLKESLDFTHNSLQDVEYVNLLTFRRSCLEDAQRERRYHCNQLRRAIARNKERVSFFRDFISSLDGLD